MLFRIDEHQFAGRLRLGDAFAEPADSLADEGLVGIKGEYVAIRLQCLGVPT